MKFVLDSTFSTWVLFLKSTHFDSTSLMSTWVMKALNHWLMSKCHDLINYLNWMIEFAEIELLIKSIILCVNLYFLNRR